MIRLYNLSNEMIKEWNALGRRNKYKIGTRTSMSTLLMDIQVLQLFVRALGQIKGSFAEYEDRLFSKGLLAFKDRLQEEFSDKLQSEVQQIVQNISFFLVDAESETIEELVKCPRIVMEYNIGSGLKLDNIRLEEVKSIKKKYKNSNSAISKVQGYLQSKTPDIVMLIPESPLQEDVAKLECEVMQYIMSYCNTFTARFDIFSDQLYIQTAFYRDALNLMDYVNRFQLETCFPKVTKQGNLLS